MANKEKSLQSTVLNYKFDDSALKIGRTPIGFRKVGEKVKPENMTRKEYIHYLCYMFDFNFGKGWDGVEKNPHVPNWSDEPEHNIKNRKDALKFLGIYDENSPSNEERRTNQRRKEQIKYEGKNKRSKIRREQESEETQQDAFLYYSALGVGFSTLILIYLFALIRIM